MQLKNVCRMPGIAIDLAHAVRTPRWCLAAPGDATLLPLAGTLRVDAPLSVAPGSFLHELA